MPKRVVLAIQILSAERQHQNQSYFPFISSHFNEIGVR